MDKSQEFGEKNKACDYGDDLWDEIWQEIFHCSQNKFKKIKKDYMDCFSDFNEKDYEDIAACIESARRTKNHLAFVRYFLEKCVCEEILFQETLQEYAKRVKCIYRKPKIKKNCFESQEAEIGIYILKGNLFRDKDYDVPNEEGMRLSRMEKTELVSRQNLIKWYSGENCPQDRYEIVQYAFYLYLTVEETNILLNLAGLQSLYPVNLMDYQCIIELNRYAGKEKVLDKEKALEIFYRRILPLKRKVNEVLEAYDNIDTSNKFVPIKKGKKSGIASFGYQGNMFKENGTEKLEDMSFEAILQGIKKEVKELTKKSGKQYEVETELWIRNYGKGKMTELYGSLAEKEKDIDEEYLKKSTMSYYELQCQIINAAKQFENYQKNFFNSGMSLIFEEELGIEGSVSFHVNDTYLRENCISDSCYKIWEKYKKTNKNAPHDEKGNSNISDKEKRKALEYIWQYPKDTETRKVIFTSATPLYHLLYGRFVTVEKKYYYEPDFTRKNLIQFCLACGQEDNIDKMLKLACFQECGITNMKSRAKRIEAEVQKEGINTVKQDKTSAFVQYAIAYRDELIQHWNKKRHLDSVQMTEQRKRFPMIQLFRNINRDIQFVIGYFFECNKLLGSPALELKDIRDDIRNYYEEENLKEKSIEFEKKIQKMDNRRKELENQIKTKKIAIGVKHGLNLTELSKLYKLDRDTTIYIYPVI